MPHAHETISNSRQHKKGWIQVQAVLVQLTTMSGSESGCNIFCMLHESGCFYFYVHHTKNKKE